MQKRQLLNLVAILAFSLSLQNVAAQPSYQPELTLEALCQQYPEKVRSLFDALNMDDAGLEKVKAEVDKANWPEACRALVAYYRNANTASWLRKSRPEITTRTDSLGEAILNDVFTFQTITARQPRTTAGSLNWQDLGPHEDVEWGYFLNRHGIFAVLLQAYLTTGNTRYVERFNTLLIDWVLNNPAPQEHVWTVTWRELEVGLRLAGAWPEVFFGFLHTEDFSPAAMILMLSSIPEHANYIMQYHRIHHNWAAMEVNGLVTAALCWPEFRQSEAWYEHARKAMAEEIFWEVYPDGVQKELTSHYHIVALRNFEEFVDICRKAQKTVPDSFHTVLEKMNNYLAYSVRPDGFGLLNNDADRDNNRERILQAAEQYGRPDWQYIISHGEKGKKPEQGPSLFFPWAGHMIFRSGWSEDALWGFFDGGPWGISHQHNDRLHLSVHAYSRDLLVDGGRYWYKNDPWRQYFVSSASHNVILVDGKGQNAQPPLHDDPVTDHHSIQKEIDFVMATFDQGFGDSRKPDQAPEIPGQHTRAVLFLKNTGWVVFDQLQVSGIHQINPMWHFHPDCSVHAEGDSFFTDDPGKGNLQIIPLADFAWKTSVIKGQEDPIQGWYSPEYNIKSPATCAVYQADINGTQSFAWVLLPGKDQRSKVNTSILAQTKEYMRIQLAISDHPSMEIAIRWSGKNPVPLSNGYQLEGDCAVLRKGEKPLVANGKILDANGREIVVR